MGNYKIHVTLGARVRSFWVLVSKPQIGWIFGFQKILYFFLALTLPTEILWGQSIQKEKLRGGEMRSGILSEHTCLISAFSLQDLFISFLLENPPQHPDFLFPPYAPLVLGNFSHLPLEVHFCSPRDLSHSWESLLPGDIQPSSKWTIQGYLKGILIECLCLMSSNTPYWFGAIPCSAQVYCWYFAQGLLL